MKKFLDIGIDAETIPTQDEYKIEQIKTIAESHKPSAPSMTKDEFGKLFELEEKVVKAMTLDGLKQMWIDKNLASVVAEKFDEIHRKTSFSAGEGGEIISFSAKTFFKSEDGTPLMVDPVTVYRYKGQEDMTEVNLLTRIVNWLGAIDDYAAANGLTTRFVGANVMGFDMRFIAQRCAINGVPMPKSGMTWLASSYDRSKYFDVLDVWSFGDKTQRPSLDRLCRYLDVDTSKFDEEGKIDGSMVWPIWRDEGQTGAERIARYNARDVMVLEPIFEKIKFFIGE